MLRIIGEIDVSNAAARGATPQQNIEADSLAPVIVVDLTEVSFRGAPGLTALTAGGRLARQSGTAMVVARPSRPVRRMLEITGLEAVLTVREEE